MKKDPEMTKSYLKLVFLTLFLDLVGFSIIFPLFPEMIQYYQEIDGNNFLLKGILDFLNWVLIDTENASASTIVLFGGILGAIYSLLQFLAAPFWGSLSDRIGRRPVLLISVAGLCISYIIWFFAGNFTILILARFIGGLMSGNISTATAVVADVTDKEGRSKGMAIIGVAFAIGFIIGPAMGGILSQVKINLMMPSWTSFGVNPFSMPALVAAVLSLVNFLFLLAKFKESLSEEFRGKQTSHRSNSLIKLFKPLPYPGVNATNIGYFLFISMFSGMEFTLTFLAMERLGFSSMDNAYMFIYIGILIALFQGGLVRRLAPKVGEVRLTLVGLFSLIPGLLIVGISHSVEILYLGLFFLALGSSFTIPCLTSLVSLYTPKDEQGHSIGIFRSLGSLARVVGPIVASVFYWVYGASSAYFIGAISLVLPIIIVFRLKQPVHEL